MQSLAIDLPAKPASAEQPSNERAENTRRSILPQLGARLPALTGLRGVAVLLVVLQHSWLGSHHDGTPFIDHWFKSFGGLWFGVDLFFVLSGFLLTRILLETKTSQHYYRNFYTRRCLRIAPIYYAFILGAIVCGQTHFQSPSALPWVATFLTNVLIFLKQDWSVFLAGIPIVHFWSLAVEEHFYVVWPAIIKHHSHRLVGLCVTGMILSIAIRALYLLVNHNGFAYDTIHILTPFRLDSFLAGSAVACMLQSTEATARVRKLTKIALIASSCLFGGLLSITHMNYANPAVATIGYTINAIAFASVISSIVNNGSGLLSRTCSHRFFLFFGKYSYAIYVLHLPIVTLFNRQLLLHHMGMSPIAVVGLGMLAPFGCTTLLSILSWHLLEKRFLKLKDRFV